MRNIYIAFRNLLVFVFVVSVFGIESILKDTSVQTLIGAGLIYGILVMLIPNILKFFKLPVNNGSIFLVNLLLSCLFFFSGIYILGLFEVTAGRTVDFWIAQVVIADRTIALVVLSMFSGVISTGMEILRQSRR